MASKMARIWANRLEDGTRTWAEVPASRKNAVREVLRGDVASGVISEARYEEITGEPY